MQVFHVADHERAADHETVLSAARKRRIPVASVTRKKLDGLVATGASADGSAGGIAAAVGPLALAGRIGSLDELLSSGRRSARDRAASDERMDAERPRIFVALDQVWDPHNVGAILRSCAFLGVEAVVKTRFEASAALSPLVSRVSAGAMESLAIYETDRLSTLLKQPLQSTNWEILATCLEDDRSVSIESVSATLPANANVLVCFGNEAHGVQHGVLDQATQLVHIEPSAGHGTVQSLNVSVACGIILNALRRMSA